MRSGEVRRALEERSPELSSARFRLALVLLRGLPGPPRSWRWLDAAPEGVVEGYGALRARALVAGAPGALPWRRWPSSSRRSSPVPGTRI